MYFNTKNQSTIYIDGKYLKVDAKILEAFTPGVLQATGVFETMLAVGTKVFHIEDHLRRLHNSFKGIKVSPKVIERIVELNQFDFSRVRVVAFKQGTKNHVAVMALKYKSPSNRSFKVCLIKTDRLANSKEANRKSLNYKLFENAYKRAKTRGYDEALLINKKGFIFEASRANVFWIKDSVIYTTPLSSGCLNGIMRQKVIKHLKKLKLSFKEQDLSPTELKYVDAMFLTNSLIGMKRVKLFFPSLPR